MYTSEEAVALGVDAVGSGHMRSFMTLDSQAVVSLPALQDVSGGSATRKYLEYDFMRMKRRQHLRVELEVQAGT